LEHSNYKNMIITCLFQAWKTQHGIVLHHARLEGGWCRGYELDTGGCKVCYFSWVWIELKGSFVPLLATRCSKLMLC